MSNIWVGLAVPDYEPSRLGLGFGARRLATNSAASGLPYTNAPGSGPSYVYGRAGLPPYVDWRRHAKFYQVWTRPDAQTPFIIRHLRSGTYTLPAIPDGVLAEFTLPNATVTAAATHAL